VAAVAARRRVRKKVNTLTILAILAILVILATSSIDLRKLI
jgi:hypothetical protein